MLDQRAVRMYLDLQAAAGCAAYFIGELADVFRVEVAVGVGSGHIPLGLRPPLGGGQRQRGGHEGPDIHDFFLRRLSCEFVRPPVRASIAEKLEHGVADRERRGEARGLDAEEIDQARDAVVGRALEEEIARGLAARLELGPDSGIRGLQGAVRRSEEHTSELQSLTNIVCRLLLEKKKKDFDSTFFL